MGKDIELSVRSAPCFYFVPELRDGDEANPLGLAPMRSIAGTLEPSPTEFKTRFYGCRGDAVLSCFGVNPTSERRNVPAFVGPKPVLRTQLAYKQLINAPSELRYQPRTNDLAPIE